MALGFINFYENDRLVGPNGEAIGATIYFYYSGTTNIAPIYTDIGLVNAKTNPYSVAVGAILPVVYLDSKITYRRRTVYSDGTVQDIDPVSSSTSLFSALAGPTGSSLVGTPQTTLYDLMYKDSALSLLRGPKTFARTWQDVLDMSADLSAMRGYAAYAGVTGGGGFPVYKVWNDSDDETTVGSVRWAVAAARAGGGGRILGVPVGQHTVQLRTMLALDFDNITIDFPGRNWRFGALNDVEMVRVSGKNIIVRRMPCFRYPHYTGVDDQFVEYSTASGTPPTSGQTVFNIPFTFFASNTGENNNIRVMLDKFIRLDEGVDADYVVTGGTGLYGSTGTVVLKNGLATTNNLRIYGKIYQADGISLKPASCDKVWVDQCTLTDHTDGALDIASSWLDVNVIAAVMYNTARYEITTTGTTDWKIFAGTPAWAASTAYAVGAKVTNGSNIYTCTVAGTSAASGGPTGTSPGPDNTVTWSYTSAAPTYTTGSVFTCAAPSRWVGGTAYTVGTKIIGDIPYRWLPSVAYTVGAKVTNGANTYVCTTAGTSAGSVGPSGTGTGITDGTAVWSYQVVAGNIYVCTTAGTSASVLGPTGTGGSITDGSVIWAYQTAVGTGVVKSAAVRATVSRCWFRRQDKNMLIGSTATSAQNPPPLWASNALAQPTVLFVTLDRNVFEGASQRSPSVSGLAFVHSVNNVHVMSQYRDDTGLGSGYYAAAARTGAKMLSSGDYLRLGGYDIPPNGMYGGTDTWSDTTRVGPGAFDYSGTVAETGISLVTANTGSVPTPPYSITVDAIPATNRLDYVFTRMSQAGAEVAPLSDQVYSFVDKATGDAQLLWPDGLNVISVAGGYRVRMLPSIPSTGTNAVTSFVAGNLSFPRGPTLTMVSGSVALRANWSFAAIDTEALAATDTLININQPSGVTLPDGWIFGFRIAANTRTITISSAGNIRLPNGSLFIDSTSKPVWLRWDTGGFWTVVSSNGRGEGEYTPTLTNVANVASSSVTRCFWARENGSAYVTVWYNISVTPTATATLTDIGLTLPVASNLAVANDLLPSGGTAGLSSTFSSVTSFGDTTNDRATIRFNPASAGAWAVSGSFRYKII